MKTFRLPPERGLVSGLEHDADLFLRKETFASVYSETELHRHPNSYEFYVVLRGRLTLEDAAGRRVEIPEGYLVHFGEDEAHRISGVAQESEVLLIKALGAEKKIDRAAPEV